MNRRVAGRESQAVGLSIFFLALGFGSIWLTKEILEIQTDAVFVSLLIAPILIFVILSGRLKELRAPGGLEAKFSDAAEESVEATVGTIEASVQDMEVVAKGGLEELQPALQRIDEAKPTVLSLTLGKGSGYYSPWAILEYMKRLSQRNFKFVLIADAQGKLVAYIPSWALKQMLEAGPIGEQFIRAVNDGRPSEVARYPGVITRSLSTGATNIEALREMMALNLEALVVTDENGKLKGVAEREQVLSRLILAMAK